MAIIDIQGTNLTTSYETTSNNDHTLLDFYEDDLVDYMSDGKIFSSPFPTLEKIVTLIVNLTH